MEATWDKWPMKLCINHLLTDFSSHSKEVSPKGLGMTLSFMEEASDPTVQIHCWSDSSARRPLPLRRGRPDVQVALAGESFDLGEFFRRERQVLEGADAVNDLFGAARADER